METIRELMQGRTTLIATHRLPRFHDLEPNILLEHGLHRRAKAAVRSWSRAAAFTRNLRSAKISIMKNVRRIGMWKAIGGRSRSRQMWNSAKDLLRDAQIFRQLAQHKTARGRNRRPCFLLRGGCSFSGRGERSLPLAISLWLKWGADHGRRQKSTSVALPRFLERRHRRFRFHPVEPAQRLIDAAALAPFSKIVRLVRS